MMQWIKKISVLGLALFILSGGVGSAAPKKDDLQDILLYPRVGVLIFMDSGLRGDDKIQDQLRTAVQQKMNKIKDITYLNDTLMTAKFQEFSFRKNIQEGNDLFPYGQVTQAQLAEFAKENRLSSLVILEGRLKKIDENTAEVKPGEEAKSQFTSQVELQLKVLSPERNVIRDERIFTGESKSDIAIKSYWAGMKKAIGQFKSDWKPKADDL